MTFPNLKSPQYKLSTRLCDIVRGAIPMSPLWRIRALELTL